MMTKILPYKFKWIWLLFLTTISVYYTSCKKPAYSDKIFNNTFLHVYSATGNQTALHIRETDDEGFLIIGNKDLNAVNDNKALLISRINKNGELLWQKTLSAEAFRGPACTFLPDGSSLIVPATGVGNLIKLDKNGNKIFETQFEDNSNNYNYSYPMQFEDGYFGITYSNGLINGNLQSDNYLAYVDPDGNFIGTRKYNDTEILGQNVKTLFWSYYKAQSPGNGRNYILGWCYKNWNYNWSVNRKLFVSRLDYNNFNLTARKVVILDPTNEVNTNLDLYYVNTADNKLILAATQKELSENNKGHIYKLDDDFNKIWEIDLRIGEGGTFINAITECKDGNYLLSGTCKINGNKSDNPFVCKLSKDGIVLWSQIYTSTLSGSMAYSIETKNGNIMMTGHTNGFGKGTALNDIFVMKADKNGNYK
jgi:hypothetical protein